MYMSVNDKMTYHGHTIGYDSCNLIIFKLPAFSMELNPTTVNERFAGLTKLIMKMIWTNEKMHTRKIRKHLGIMKYGTNHEQTYQPMNMGRNKMSNESAYEGT